MANTIDNIGENHDVNAQNRKKDHIDFAFVSRTDAMSKDTRFVYEPLLSGHPDNRMDLKKTFLGKTFGAPIWISSMTGGTAHARNINHRLATLVGKYKLGMGLGSCRQLLFEDTYLEDFAVRKLVNEQPLYANLGIAQVESLIEEGQSTRIKNLIIKLEADGLIVHINPIQEWLQPEGDRYTKSPIDTLKRLLDVIDCPIIVKEVGQGMGPRSLEALLALPITAIEFAAYGGTNFGTLEILRSKNHDEHPYQRLPYIGHTAIEMLEFLSEILDNKGNQSLPCQQIILSGGITDFLDGYYLQSNCPLPSIYGHASTFLKYAIKSYEDLEIFLESQMEGLKLAHALLKVNKRDEHFNFS